MDFTVVFKTLQKHQNKDVARQMSAYMLHQFEFLGLQSPIRKELMKPFFKEEKKAVLDWSFVEQCWGNLYRELQYIKPKYK